MNEIIWLFIIALVITVCIVTVIVLKKKFEKSSLEKIDTFKKDCQNLITIKNKIIAGYKLTDAKMVEQQEFINELQVQIKTLSEQPVAPAVVEPVKSMKSILVVDDSLVVRNKMKKLLETAGYEIVTANDGLEALDKLPNKNFSMVITDLEMPNLNGFGLIIKVNENPETKGIPIMAITGHEEMEIKIGECENLYSISKKPWVDDEVLKKVAILCSIKN